MRPSLALVLALTCAAPAVLVGQVAPPSPIEAALPRLAVLLREGIETREPSASIWRRAERPSVFDGSYDWHSCIAAHWAALSLARVEGDDALRDAVLDRLSPQALAAERQLRADLAPRPTVPGAVEGGGRGAEAFARSLAYFTPYADAWLLLLLDELVRHHRQDDEDLLGFRIETEFRVLRALEDGPFPERVPSAERGGKPFCGFYRSWLFGYLMLRLAGPSNDEVAARLDALARTRLAPQRDALAAYRERHTFDFLHVRALHALAERVDPTVAEPVAFPVPDAFEALPDRVTLRTVHPVGVCVSELWPLASDAPEDPDARAAFERRTAEILGRTDLWADDFEVVSHWVPQFLWFGIWLARGAP